MLLALLAGGLLKPAALSAQTASRVSSDGGLLEAGIASIVVDGYSLSSLTDVAASLWGDSGRLSGTGTVSAAHFESGNVTGYGELHGSAAFSSDSRNPSSFKLDAGGGSYHGTKASSYVESSVLLGPVAHGLLSSWLDAGAGRVSAATTPSTATTAHARIAVSLITSPAAITADLGLFEAGSSRYTDATLRARVAPFGTNQRGVARLVAGVDAGARASHDVPGRHAWLMAVATVLLGGPVSLVGYAGQQPPDPERGAAGTALTSVALRMSFGGASVAARSPPVVAVARATRVSSESDDGRRAIITVSAPDVRTVELMGDFTGWLPVPMVRAGPGIWRTRLALPQGSHRIEIRADSGVWVPPPGLPVAADEFGSRVGILVVP